MLVASALDARTVGGMAAGAGRVIHVDQIGCRWKTHDGFCAALLMSLNLVSATLSLRRGTWGLVAASQDRSEMMLNGFATCAMSIMASGFIALPLRPVKELIDYLPPVPRTDFIRKRDHSRCPWTVGGLGCRTTLYHCVAPFVRSRHRYLFDKSVAVSASSGSSGVSLRASCRIWSSPNGWCLTRQTLSAILQDPTRAGIRPPISRLSGSD